MEKSFNGHLEFIKINGFRIVEPPKEIRLEIRDKAEEHLRSKFSAGFYTDPKQCNAIFHHMFEFYEAGLNASIPKIATAWWVAGIVFQHEQSGKIGSAYRQGSLSDEDATYWRDHGAVLRQALDYMCEKLNELGVIDVVSTSQQDQVPDFLRSLVCAKHCVEYSTVSNLTYMVLPNATSVTIHPEGSLHFLEHHVDSEVHAKMKAHQIQNNREVSIRDQYYQVKPTPFELDLHVKVLDQPFQKEFGITYAQFQSLVASLVINSPEIKDPRQVPMQLKEKFYSNAAHNNALTEGIVTPLLDQLIMERKEPRKIWDSRQFNRLNKRPIMDFQSRGREVVMWSHDKIGDFFKLLDEDLIFNKPPETWRTPLLRAAATEISIVAGRWFEKCAMQQLRKLGFVGRDIKTDTFKKYPTINFDCGQIDFLGYHPASNCFCIFEFKMIETGFEARGARQVSSKFLSGTDSYLVTFNRKINWVRTNIDFLKGYFSDELKVGLPAGIAVTPIFLTYFPTLMSLFMTEMPCKSLIEFIESWNAKKGWPY